MTLSLKIILFGILGFCCCWISVKELVTITKKDTKYLDLLLAHFRKNNSSLNQPLPYYYLIINIA